LYVGAGCRTARYGTFCVPISCPIESGSRVWASPARPDTGLRCLLIVPGLLELSG
jgi:hypothetical protein